MSLIAVKEGTFGSVDEHMKLYRIVNPSSHLQAWSGHPVDSVQLLMTAVKVMSFYLYLHDGVT